MKIGILSFAHHHAESYVANIRAMPDVELIGIADEDLERAGHYADRFETPLYSTYKALLAAGPDGVIVCSENSKHLALTELAAQAGVHVLCEKPLATTLDDAQRMIDVCRHAGVTLMTAFPMRFNAPAVQVRKSLKAGDLGQLYCLNTTNQGRMPIHEGSWFVDPELAGGGAIIDHTVHLADLMRWYLECEVVEVYAVSNRIMHGDLVDVETGGLLMLTFSDGTFATIDASWSKPLNYPTWGGLTMELISERGLTVVDAFSQNLNLYQQEPASNTWIYWGSDADRGMLQEFIDAIREQRPPAVTGEDGYRALEIARAAYESAENGEPVRLSQSDRNPELGQID